MLRDTVAVELVVSWLVSAGTRNRKRAERKGGGERDGQKKADKLGIEEKLLESTTTIVVTFPTFII